MGSFELTDEEYQFLLDDIEEAIAEGNRKLGYGGYGFVDRFGNHYRDPQPRTVPESDLAIKALGYMGIKTNLGLDLNLKAIAKSRSRLRARPQIHYTIGSRRKKEFR